MNAYPDVYLIQLAIWFGLVFTLGYTLQKTQFCIMGQMARFTLYRDWHSLIFLFTIFSTLLTLSLVAYCAGLIDLPKIHSQYTYRHNQWYEVAVAGFIFGVGMVLCGGCVSRNITRLSAGNIKSLFVILIVAISAFFTGAYNLKFPSFTDGPEPIPAMLLNEPAFYIITIAAFIISSLTHVWQRLQKQEYGIIILITVVTVSGWMLTTGTIAHQVQLAMTFSDLPDINTSGQSLNTIGPLAHLFLGIIDKDLKIDWPVVTILGLFLGGLVSALLNKQFRIDWFAHWPDFLITIIGSICLGVGGVIALGCSFGSLTGSSAFSPISMLALITMLFGCFCTIKLRYHLSSLNK